MSITRTCRSCGRPLPASKRSDAVYCTAACSSRAHRRRSGIGPRAKRCRDRPEASLAKEDAAYRTAIEAQTAALAVLLAAERDVMNELEIVRPHRQPQQATPQEREINDTKI
jgi:hypothetical protein